MDEHAEYTKHMYIPVKQVDVSRLHPPPGGQWPGSEHAAEQVGANEACIGTSLVNQVQLRAFAIHTSIKTRQEFYKR